jgi:RHS repeat-associated protein
VAGSATASNEEIPMCKRVLSWLALPIVILATLLAGSALADNVVTYYHNDVLGSPVAVTDDQGQVMWTAQYRPYGERVQSAADAQASADNSRWYAGHVFDNEFGLSYMGARYYDPKIGRFMGVDPQPFSPANVQSFGRYTYTNDNPYSYVDPDGELPILVGIVLWNGGKAAVENIVTQRVEMAVGLRSSFSYTELAQDTAIGAITGPFGSARTGARAVNIISKVAKTSEKAAAKTASLIPEEAATVQRWMSKAELQATKDSGLLRGGREGTHHVTDAANSDPLRARQRLALDKTPEVRVTMKVPKDALSEPSKVDPNFSMPGGGIERTATGNVPVQIIKVN